MNGFPCPVCGNDSETVVDSRMTETRRRRRRECNQCAARFTTYELMENEAELLNEERLKAVAGQLRDLGQNFAALASFFEVPNRKEKTNEC